MLWITLGLLAPACWACGNHIDAYLLRLQPNGRGIGTLLLFSAWIGLPALVLIAAYDPAVLVIAPLPGAILIANGALYVLGLLPYLLALQHDEASVVVPLFQITAVWSYLLGLVVLDEQLTLMQIGAALLVICGSILISLEIAPRRAGFKRTVFGLMLLASLLNALNWLLFKVVAIEETFWRSSFWEYVGFVLVGLLLLCIRSYRNDLRVALGKDSSRSHAAVHLHAPEQRTQGLRATTFLELVALNEVLGLVAKSCTNIASLLAPLALVAVLNGLQPLFVFLFGALLTIHLPRYGAERLGRYVVLQKLAAIVLMIVGTSLLALT